MKTSNWLVDWQETVPLDGRGLNKKLTKNDMKGRFKMLIVQTMHHLIGLTHISNMIGVRLANMREEGEG